MRSILLVGALSLSFACASGRNSSATRRDLDLISEEEVEASMGGTAYEIVTRVRPAFLKTRGIATTKMSVQDHAMVYVNGVRFGDINSLKNIPGDQIREIRYYNARDAIQKFGTQDGTGVIDVSTR